MYDKVPTDFNFPGREEGVLEFWAANGVFKKFSALRGGNEKFTFYDGPPTANGKPHIGHLITRAIKDIIPRYKTMRGFDVLRKAGWDTHGLPVELEVERELNISGKSDIEKFGIEPFINKCKESVFKYKNDWRVFSDRVAFWADMDAPYVTYDDDYIESVWWALKTIWEKGLIYKGHKVVPYCPRCGTALSVHEVAQGYKTVCETSVYVKFKLKNENAYFLAWTTTPWTLPSNVALTVNADLDYIKAENGGETYYLAAALAETVLTGEYKVLETLKGAALTGIRYEPLFPFTEAACDRKGFFVCADGFVTLTDGTGIVHTAPAFGEDDARVGKNYNLPFVQLVDEKGCFKPEAAPYAEIFVKNADSAITGDLKAGGKLYKTQDYEHSYPFCWRCETPLIYYARNTWFIKMTAARDNLLKNNERIAWYPAAIKNGRFGNFLENVVDWGLSRERYWGTPLNIWECECGFSRAVGSKAELAELSYDGFVPKELHKPYVDACFLTCPECGGKMKRVTEVIDCWFDSGAMPFAQWHYPFENANVFGERFPADFISEAVDQTRGWFYTLLAISTLLFDRPPFLNCVVLGHVQDAEGQKMSKHKGNVVDPADVLKRHGADAARWYFYVSSAPHLPNRFSHEAVEDASRKFMGTLWNTYAFYALYAETDSFDPSAHALSYALATPMDKWIISKLHSLIKFVCKALDEYKITEAGRAVEAFTDDMSNWYVRRCRSRFWASGVEGDKITAFMTLYTALNALARLIAPFTPFIAESVYQGITRPFFKNAPVSVHLCDYPVCDESFIDETLEKNMDFCVEAAALARSARNAANIKIRIPLAAMHVKADAPPPPEFADIIAQEVNVKKVIFTDSAERFINIKIKPCLKTLGPRHGKIMPKISAYLAENGGAALYDALRENGSVKFAAGEEEVVLTNEDVLIEQSDADGFKTARGAKLFVALETALTDELTEEGLVREIISKVQTMRKAAGFNITDKIVLTFAENARLEGVITRNAAFIRKETQAAEIKKGGGTQEWNINGERVLLGVAKAAF